jgi:hypothetical protein
MTKVTFVPKLIRHLANWRHNRNKELTFVFFFSFFYSYYCCIVEKGEMGILKCKEKGIFGLLD